MAPTKKIIEKFTGDYRIVFLVVIGGLGWVFAFLQHVFNYNSMDDFIYFLTHRDGIILLSSLCFLAAFFLKIRQFKKELNGIKIQITPESAPNTQDEFLRAVGWWVQALNHSQDERDAYIAKYFPNSFNKLKEYVDVNYPYFIS